MAVEYFDKECNPITKKEWEKLRKDKSYVFLRMDKSRDRKSNGTIWSWWHGETKDYGPSGPEIFTVKASITTITLHDDGSETDKNEWEEYQCSTEEEALRIHEQLIETHTDYDLPLGRWEQVVDEF